MTIEWAFKLKCNWLMQILNEKLRKHSHCLTRSLCQFSISLCLCASSLFLSAYPANVLSFQFNLPQVKLLMHMFTKCNRIECNNCARLLRNYLLLWTIWKEEKRAKTTRQMHTNHCIICDHNCALNSANICQKTTTNDNWPTIEVKQSLIVDKYLMEKMMEKPFVIVVNVAREK